MQWFESQHHRFIQDLSIRREMCQDYQLLEEQDELIFKTATSVNATETYQMINFMNDYWAYCFYTSSRCY